MSDDKPLQAMSTDAMMAQLVGAVAVLTDQTRSNTSKLDDMRDRVIRMEAQDYKAEIAEVRQNLTGLGQRVSELVRQQDMVKGAGTFANMVREWMPSVVIVLALIIFYVKEARP